MAAGWRVRTLPIRRVYVRLRAVRVPADRMALFHRVVEKKEVVAGGERPGTQSPVAQ